MNKPRQQIMKKMYSRMENGENTNSYGNDRMMCIFMILYKSVRYCVTLRTFSVSPSLQATAVIVVRFSGNVVA